MSNTIIPKEFDLTPNPRILPMLGEINLEEWRCIAELVDNSVDAFLQAKRTGHPISNPQVVINIPMTINNNSRITIRDNAMGMSLDTLENAARAGWTNNNPTNSLGLFGMGFNIATARLGTITEVWSTRLNDKEWYGLEIDFQKLINQKHFKTPVLSRPKNDITQSGTEVIIKKLKPERNAWFAKSSNKSKLKKILGQIYSAMLRPDGLPISFECQIGETPVLGRRHCIWDESRRVNTSKYGDFSPVCKIDTKLNDRPFCQACWEWLDLGMEICPICSRKDSVIVRERHIYGWIGVQRFLDPYNYGIDFIRNGRKIELNNKDLFQWDNGEGAIEPEYPIDDPRNRGRFVGEIHIDHCRVSYTKDRFDRNDPAWQEMTTIVRGEGPLRPDKAKQAGFSDNISPLFRLFQIFRRSSPLPKVAGCYEKLLVIQDNDRVMDMYKSFEEGDPAYQSDEKWFELIKEADRELLVRPKTKPNDGTTTPPIVGDLLGKTKSANPTTDSQPTPKVEYVRKALPFLTRLYTDEITNIRWDIKAFAIESSDSALINSDVPWVLHRNENTGAYEFLVNEKHSIFQSATLTPLDGLLAQLSWQIADFCRGNSNNSHEGLFQSILYRMRNKYAIQSKLDPLDLQTQAKIIFKSIAINMVKHLEKDDAQLLFNELGQENQQIILKIMASRAIANAQQIINEGKFLELAPPKMLFEFFRKHPEFFFDGKCWDDSYSNLDYGSESINSEARAQIVNHYSSLLIDAIWLTEQDANELGVATRARLLRAMLALDMLEPLEQGE
jgi:hypothetical protein